MRKCLLALAALALSTLTISARVAPPPENTPSSCIDKVATAHLRHFLDEATNRRCRERALAAPYRFAIMVDNMHVVVIAASEVKILADGTIRLTTVALLSIQLGIEKDRAYYQDHGSLKNAVLKLSRPIRSLRDIATATIGEIHTETAVMRFGGK